ncbi:MAG: hypothetical protein WBQ25_00885 [Nitrososphaeraceae archaeon]
MTDILHDSSGNKYLLEGTLFKYNGKDVTLVQEFYPQMIAMLRPNMTIISPIGDLSVGWNHPSLF